MRPKALFARSAKEWFSSLPIAALLLAVIFLGTWELLHSQILAFGNATWPGYYETKQTLAADAPSCDINMNIEAELQKQLAAQEESSDDDFDLFEEEPLDPEVIRAGLVNAKAKCAAQHDDYAKATDNLTPAMSTFIKTETWLANQLQSYSINSNKIILLLLLLICSITSTVVRDHIALRPMRTLIDHKVSLTVQLVANIFILISTLRYRDVQINSGIPINSLDNLVQWFYILGFGLLVLFSIWQILRIPHMETESGGNFFTALLSIPLYAYMAISAGLFFLFESQGHAGSESSGLYPGIIIHMNKLLDFSGEFVKIGLYVWVGMLLKQTRLANLVFDLFRPWKMPPEIMAFFALIVSALPTAYTGGSAIYVIAAGAVIYAELRRTGARRQLALATTAMSGSMGIILKPCLMIVIIAALNNDVTTSGGTAAPGIFEFDKIENWGLYTAGFWIFLLSAFLFLVISVIANRPKITFAPVSEALPETGKLFLPIIPYIIVIAGVVLTYSILLETPMDEYNAQIILPAVMIAVVIYDQFFTKKTISSHYSVFKGTEHALRNATNETSTHIGALLMLMGMSIALGGVFESSGDGPSFIQAENSLWLTMGMLVLVLVGIGMFMDPMGAIILVSLTIAKSATAAGINPLHFWMVTLVAFELGYLTPPVALNHLMTRHVVGEEEFDIAAEEAKHQTFYQRHERILLPILVMSTTLVMVAFIPLAFY